MLRQCPGIPEFYDNVQEFRNFTTMSNNSGILRQCPAIPEFYDNVRKFRNFATMSNNSGIQRQCPGIPEFYDNVQQFRNFTTQHPSCKECIQFKPLALLFASTSVSSCPRIGLVRIGCVAQNVTIFVFFVFCTSISTCTPIS